MEFVIFSVSYFNNKTDPALDAVNNTGRTAAFTIFGDFSPSVEAVDPTKSYDPLDGSNISNIDCL